MLVGSACSHGMNMTAKPALVTLDLNSRSAWRAWLRKNHRSSPGVWLAFYKQHAKVKSVPYADSLREALCFGWIDSLIKRLDNNRYARKFTPRRPGSKWSEINRKLWTELEATGELAEAGLAAAPTSARYAPLPAVPVLPRYISSAIRMNPKAWDYFRSLPPSHRRQYVGWIHTAKRSETRERRLKEAIAMLASSKALGLK